jgi:hypothetical protein
MSNSILPSERIPGQARTPHWARRAISGSIRNRFRNLLRTHHTKFSIIAGLVKLKIDSDRSGQA